MLPEKVILYPFACLTNPTSSRYRGGKNYACKGYKVVDGDTLKVKYKGNEESLRLIGIDSPESRVNKKARQDAQRTGEDLKTIIAMGKEATRFVKSLIKPGDTVKIEFDVQKRDKYGRLLGYVYLRDGSMLNEEIARAG